MIKEAIKGFVPQSILNYIRRKAYMKSYDQWTRDGYSIPVPHLYKQRVIQDYCNRFNYPILVETGTYLGEMVEAQKKYFERIISIELSQSLFLKAQRRFRDDKHIEIYHGDSGKVLPSLMDDIDKPAIFWLDGHYSKGITARGAKDCPIFDELAAIFSHPKFEHVFLIDDARCFTGDGEYPTVSELSDFVLKQNSNYQISVVHDIIRVEIPRF
jgi:hypothetical protein